MMEQQFTFGGEIVWRASPEQIAQTQLKQFMEAHGIGSYDELLRRSGTDIEWFWDAVIRQLGIEFYEPYRSVVDLAQGPEWARWCVDGRMNIVHNALDKWLG